MSYVWLYLACALGASVAALLMMFIHESSGAQPNMNFAAVQSRKLVQTDVATNPNARPATENHRPKNRSRLGSSRHWRLRRPRNAVFLIGVSLFGLALSMLIVLVC